jgi:hypothetical protein
VGPPPGKNGLLLTYRNNQTGGWITLEIQPQNSPAPVAAPASTYATTNGTTIPAVQPSSAAPASSATGNQQPATSASTSTTASQQPGAGQITWPAQKNGSGFILTVNGSLPGEELKKVADSVQ